MTDIGFQYGLMVVNMNEIDENGDVDILHFVGYCYPPTEDDIENLRIQILEDEEIGLTDIADTLDISIAPEEIVSFYKKQYLEWSINLN